MSHIDPQFNADAYIASFHAEAVEQHRERALAAIRRWRTEHRPGMRHVRRVYAKDALKDLRIWHRIAGVKQ
jgi:hypothetical protein